jgi:hypothetical protein
VREPLLSASTFNMITQTQCSVPVALPAFLPASHGWTAHHSTACRRSLHSPARPSPPCADPDLVATVFAPTDEAFAAALEDLNVTAAEILADTVS